jgi:hypothetical protein
MKGLAFGLIMFSVAGVGVYQSVDLDAMSIPTMLDTVSAKEFANTNGISDIVYDCAVEVLSDRSAEELVEFIQTDAVEASEGDFSPAASALRECIYLDPLGWHGTENEWAIELLNTDEWER